MQPRDFVMAREPVPQDAEPEQPAGGEPADKGDTRRARLIGMLDRHVSRKWLAILLGVSVLGHGVGFALYNLRAGRGPQEPPPREIALGDYRFVPAQPEGNPVSGAEFSLHVALLDDVGPVARRLLAQRKYRIQQGVEELLRKAHGGDFRDPALAELKRELQEQINAALGMRAIAEVIVTDLDIRRPPETPGTSTETAGPAPTSGGDKPLGATQPPRRELVRSPAPEDRALP